MAQLQGTLLFSRDFHHYRPVATPVAAVVNAFLDLLTSQDEAGAEARRAYLHCGGVSEQTIFDVLKNGKKPQVVIAKGNAGTTVESWREDDSTGSGDDLFGLTYRVRPEEAIFVPYSLHVALNGATGNLVDESVIRFMIVAGVAHEMAHWIAINVAGKKVQPPTLAPRGSVSYSPHLIRTSLPAAYNMHNVGIHAIELLFGFIPSLVFFADGSHDIAGTYLQHPNGKRPEPLLLPSTQQSLFAGKGGGVPRVADVTTQKVVVDKEAFWRKDGWAVIQIKHLGSHCHHGYCILDTADP